MSRPPRAETFELSDLVVDYDPDTLERRDVSLDTVLSRLYRRRQRLALPPACGRRGAPSAANSRPHV
jgi:hypothetical protein